MAKSAFISSNTFPMEAGASSKLRTMGQIIAASLLVALCAHVSLPPFFTPVPLTLQPFAVILLGLLKIVAAAGIAAGLKRIHKEA
jgi:biotin transporter BioY